jgi:hypothetical protein
MERRKALGRILLVGIGGTLAFGSYKWYDWNKTPDIPWLEQKKELLTALTDTILPTTNTPGARAAGIQDTMIAFLKDCTERRTQNRFISGLKDLEDYCRSVYHTPFGQASEETRIAVLSYFEKKDKPLPGIWGKASGRYLGKPFFTTLKEYTVKAYCTSEKGATLGLRYDPVPGSYHGCLPWQEGQRAWATK